MSAAANQMRQMLRTAAYWLLWTVQQAIPESAALKRAEFATLQIRLVKIDARITETAWRMRIAFASACPQKALLDHLVKSLGQPATASSAVAAPITSRPPASKSNPKPKRTRRSPRRAPPCPNRSEPDQVNPKPA